MRREGKVDLTVYRDRTLITFKTIYTGIRIIYKWCPVQQKYIPRKDGKKYLATIKLYGTQKEKHFEKLDDARRWRMSGDSSILKTSTAPFSEVMDKYFEHAKSRVNLSTWQTYQNSTKHLEFFLKFPVSSITSFMIDQWLLKIKQPEYLKTQHQTRFTYTKELKVLKQVLKYYSEYIDESYLVPVKQRHNKDVIIDLAKMKKAKARNQGRYLSAEEQLRFFEALKEITASKNRVCYYLAIFQLQTGTRIGEACAVSWSDVDFIDGSVSIGKSVHWGRGKGAETYVQPFTKTGESRKVHMTTFLKALLLDMNQGATPGLVFSFDGVNPLPYRTIQYFFDKAFERAGISHRSTHILRHTFSTDYLTATKDHVSLSRLLGHASTRQTEHYAKVTGTLTSDSFQTFKEDTEEKLGKVLNF